MQPDMARGWGTFLVKIFQSMSECSQILQIIAFVTKVDTLSMVVQRVTGLVLTLHSEIKTVSVLARGPEISETVQKHHLFRPKLSDKRHVFLNSWTFTVQPSYS